MTSKYIFSLCLFLWGDITLYLVKYSHLLVIMHTFLSNTLILLKETERKCVKFFKHWTQTSFKRSFTVRIAIGEGVKETTPRPRAEENKVTNGSSTLREIPTLG